MSIMTSEERQRQSAEGVANDTRNSVKRIEEKLDRILSLLTPPQAAKSNPQEWTEKDRKDWGG